jgi:hypothetical protein
MGSKDLALPKPVLNLDIWQDIIQILKRAFFKRSEMREIQKSQT